MTLKALDHVAVVVADLDAALSFWQDALGMQVARTEHNAAEEVRIAFLPLGESEIELLEPANPESGIGRYLAKRGPGMHHLCFEVTDIDAAIQRIAAGGVELINPEPRTRADGTRYAFVHPGSTGGVLVELYEKPA